MTANDEYKGLSRACAFSADKLDNLIFTYIIKNPSISNRRISMIIENHVLRITVTETISQNLRLKWIVNFKLVQNPFWEF